MTEMMRAWRFHGNKKIERAEVAVPEPGAGEVRVRIGFVGICGTDLHEYYEGPIVTNTAAHPVTGAHAPMIPGHEASGIVDAVGPGVDDFAIGDRVVIEPIYGIVRESSYNVDAFFYGYHAHGFLADKAVVFATSLHHLPGAISLADGALVEPLSVAVHAVKRANPATDGAVVVFGAGPIGTGLALVLRARGIHDVIVIEPSPVRSEALGNLGFTVLDPTAETFDERLDAVLGGPVALVFDAAGAPPVIGKAIQLLRSGGTLMVVATYSKPPAVDTLAMLGKELSLVTVNAYSDGDFQETISLLEQGRISSSGWVATVGFDDAVEVGYPSLRDATAAKVLVEVGGEG
jgi:(R,R)-butanediol dehydrogenase/meso-butanediol dehydrogenase/diacetyl reductase